MITSADFAVILPELVLVCGAIAVLMVDAFLPSVMRRAGAALTSGILFGALLTLLQGAPSRYPAFGALLADSFTDLVGVLVIVSAFLVVASAWTYLEERDLPSGEFMAGILVAAAGMILIARSSHLLVIFVALEIFSVALYMLIGYDRMSAASTEAGIKYFILGAFASAVFLFGAVLLYGVTGTMFLTLDQMPFHTRIGQIGIVLCIAGLGFKISAAPFHLWTPDVYQGAPVPVAAFLSSASKIAGFAALVRIVYPAFLPYGEGWHTVWPILSALTMVVGNVVALVQADVKRILAYSSIAHVGFMLMALAGGGEVGVVGAEGLLFYLVTYSAAAIGAFSVIAVIPGDEQGNVELNGIRGMSTSHPWIAGLFSVFLLSLAGLPPLAGFFGKLYAFRAAIDGRLYALAVLAAINSAMAMYYYLRIIVSMYMENRVRPAALTVSPSVYPTLMVTALVIVLLGLFPDAVLVMIRASAEAILPALQIARAF